MGKFSRQVSGLLACLLFVSLASVMPAALAAPDPVESRAVARPVVSAVKPTSGTILGGTKIRISGKNLKGRTTVLIGGRRAKLLSATNTRLVVKTPAGTRGKAAVVVKTRGGKSRVTKRTRYAYKVPANHARGTYTTRAATVTASGVNWVTGGGRESASGEQSEPWLVNIAESVTAPEVGTPYFLPPGGAVFPSGLAGKVSTVAAQADGTVTLTVTPAPLNQVLSNLTVSAAMSGGSLSARMAAATSATTIKPSAFDCEYANGAVATFTGEVGLKFENVAASGKLDAGWFGRGWYVEGQASLDAVIYGKATVDAGVTCELNSAWQNANRKVIPIGSSGVTVSAAPEAELKFSGRGTFSFEDRTRITTGARADSGGLRPVAVATHLGSSARGDVDLNASAYAGLSVQIGVLDRAGIQLRPIVGAEGEIRLTTGPPPQACASGNVYVRFTIGAFLDLWVRRWETDAFDKKWKIADFRKCAAPEAPAEPSGAPEITSSRLPDATRDSEYQTSLTTSDGRQGRWSVIGGALPAGLSLASDGSISGTPSGAVGESAALVRFTDTSSRSDEAWIKVYVAPATQLGGGAVQVTLTWTSAADLDLHLIDTAGEHIYYGNEGPSTTGGLLDHDSQAGCGSRDEHPAENIYWPSGQVAPAGAYIAWVNVWSTCGASDLSWTLTVRVGGRVARTLSGSGNSDEVWFSVGPTGRVTTRIKEFTGQRIREPKI